MHQGMDLKKLVIGNKEEVKIQKKIKLKQKMVEKSNKMSTQHVLHLYHQVCEADVGYFSCLFFTIFLYNLVSV